jgi:hypothetical protein
LPIPDWGWTDEPPFEQIGSQVRLSFPVQSKIENPKSKILEWEVLPPEEEQKKRAGLEALFKWLAVVMDECIRFPGTKFRFGLDPLIGLIPGLGDTASAIVSAMSLIYAARCGVPLITLARMSLNILINEAVGIIPGVGDAFSFWFKSNARNYELLQRQYPIRSTRARRGDWIFVVVVLGVLAIVVALGIAVSLLVLRAFLHLLHVA